MWKKNTLKKTPRTDPPCTAATGSYRATYCQEKPILDPWKKQF